VRFEWMVALRFLAYGRLQTALIIVAIAVGTAVQLFLSILITGLQADLIKKTVGSLPHISAQAQREGVAAAAAESGGLSAAYPLNSGQEQRPIFGWPAIIRQMGQIPQVSGAAAVINGSGTVVYGEKTLPVAIKGIDAGEAEAIYDLRGRIVQGRTELAGSQLLMGVGLAQLLNRGLGDTVQLTTSGGSSDLFTISGLVDYQNQSLNESLVFTARQRADALLGMDGGVSEIDLQVRDVFAAEAIARGLSASFPDLRWISWQEGNASLLSALRSQSSSSQVIQFFVLLAVTLGIASVLAVSAVQKSRQIGIMKALGALTGSVSRIFLIQGALLGLIGSLCGALLGIGILRGFIYFTSLGGGAPLFLLQLEPTAFIRAVAIATAAGTAAAYFPARRSASLNPIEVIRNG